MITAETMATVPDPCSKCWFQDLGEVQTNVRRKRHTTSKVVSTRVASVVWHSWHSYGSSVGGIPSKVWQWLCEFPISCSTQSWRRIHSNFLVSSQSTSSDQQDPQFLLCHNLWLILNSRQCIYTSAGETHNKWSGFGQRCLTGFSGVHDIFFLFSQP